MTSSTVGPGMATRMAEASAKARKCSRDMGGGAFYARRASAAVDERPAGKEAAQHRLEGREGHGVVVGIEGALIPLLAEGRGALEHRMAAIGVPRVAVEADVVIVVIALDHAM